MRYAGVDAVEATRWKPLHASGINGASLGGVEVSIQYDDTAPIRVGMRRNHCAFVEMDSQFI